MELLENVENKNMLVWWKQNKSMQHQTQELDVTVCGAVAVDTSLKCYMKHLTD